MATSSLASFVSSAGGCFILLGRRHLLLIVYQGGIKIKLPKAYADYIEFELMHYKRMKQELEQARADIIHAGPVKDLSCIRGSGISNPTEAKAIRLADNPYLKHHERTCKAIERALKLGGEPAQEFFNYKYLSRGNWQNSQDIHIGQSTFFRRRKILIRQVAEQMGLIQP